MADQPRKTAVQPPKKPPPPNYITPAGFKRLTEELTFLRTKKRPEVVSALADAAAEGDRSENAEYIYRKRQLRQIDSRLRFLSKRLDDVRIVDPKAQPHRDRIFFGATVTVEGRTLRFPKHLAQEGRLGVIRWLSIFLGTAGTYRKNDSVDVVFEAGGKRVVASGLPITSPADAD